jgi:predicted HTH transcriptional regulator
LRKYRQSIDSGEQGLAAWQSFFLSCLERQATELEHALENAFEGEDIQPLAEQLLELARAQGQLTVRESAEITDANRNVLNVHLSKLVRRGLLRRKGVGKGIWYEPV